MKRINKTILECSPEEIIAIGKKLIDYYIEKSNKPLFNPLYGSTPNIGQPIKLGDQPFSPEVPPQIFYTTDKTVTKVKNTDLDAVRCETLTVDSINVDLEGANNA